MNATETELKAFSLAGSAASAALASEITLRGETVGASVIADQQPRITQ